MLISIITLFPKMFESVFSFSIPSRAQKEEKIKIQMIDLRDFGIGRHKTVDDKPYGGGTGMVLRVDVLDNAIQKARTGRGHEAVILLDPKGQKYNQETAEKFAEYDHLILVCGHYEGVDDRVRNFVDFETSIGDYVLSGGEIASIVVIDSIIRLVPGVLKKENVTSLESHSKIGGLRILEYPHYTRPEVYKRWRVPKILLSGNFKMIEEYRFKKAREVTKKRRPDLSSVPLRKLLK